MRKKPGTIKAEADSGMKKLMGDRIKRIRDHRRLSALSVSEKIGISRSALTQIETGRNGVSAVQLWKIAGVLHCGINEFFPEVPDSASFREDDAVQIAKENEEAAVFMKKAYKIK